MKKKILYMAAAVICLSIATGSTLAYFTADDTAHNVITTNQVDVEIVQKKLDGGVWKEDDGDSIRIMPATTVGKTAAAKSVEAAAWIRMNYELEILDSRGNNMVISEEELKNLITIENDETNWKEIDGWWYYKTALNAGETTKPLFKEITFSGPGMGNEYQNCTVEIELTAHGVQKANNGGSVTEAAGWPE